MKYKNFIPLFLLLLVFALYGGSISFPFIYDDIWRIVRNDAVKTLAQPLRFFTDPSTQAGTPLLHQDNYRPLSVLLTAVEVALWGESPADFRLLNLILHSLNAWLVFLLGIRTLKLSVGAAAVATLLFLVHPVQTESVVWISSQSNLAGTALFLVGLLTWGAYLKNNRARDRAASLVLYAVGLMVRETMIVFPLACFLMERALMPGKIKPNPRAVNYSVLGGMAAVYLIVRQILLGQISQSPLWGGGVVAHAANVVKTFPLFLKTIFWPELLRVSYSDLPIALDLNSWDILEGILLLGGVVGGAAALSQKSRWRSLSFCLILFLILWLPVSNVIPLRTLFAERFLYPLLIPVAWALACLLDYIWKQELSPWLRVSFVAVPLLLMILSLKTVFQIKVWVQEYDLWAHAAHVAPRNWFPPFNLSALFIQGAVGRPPHISQTYLRMAEEACLQSLANKPPLNAGGDLFFRLAIIYKMRGDSEKARQYAERAFQIRPELEKVWKPQ